MLDNKGYKVGKGRPPQDSQFKKGMSGNPKGRPKGRTSLLSAMESLLQNKHKVKIKGETKDLIGIEAIATIIFHSALAKNSQAMKVLLELESTLASKEAYEDSTFADPDLALNEFIRDFGRMNRVAAMKNQATKDEGG